MDNRKLLIYVNYIVAIASIIFLIYSLIDTFAHFSGEFGNGFEIHVILFLIIFNLIVLNAIREVKIYKTFFSYPSSHSGNKNICTTIKN